MKPQEQKLRDALQASHKIACWLDEPCFPLLTLESLQAWQRNRLAGTYSDLLTEQQFRAAGHFFLDELYGGLEFRERDREVEHVLPVMVRMLPGYMLASMSDAFELQAMSLDLDIDMARRMKTLGWTGLDKIRYARLYRQTGREQERRKQVDLIYQLGFELIELVQHRLVLRLVRLLRFPARAAGFGRLQNFLEGGLFAFRAMHDGDVFIEAISERETAIMLGLLEGDAGVLDVRHSFS